VCVAVAVAAASLIRWVVTPVHLVPMGTGASGSGELLGVLVAGDIVNGKNPTTYLPTLSLGAG
jgi:hypothetical protein